MNKFNYIFEGVKEGFFTMWKTIIQFHSLILREKDALDFGFMMR